MQQQLQYGVQQFSQTEAKHADSICKPRRPVFVSFCLRAPAALRGAPGELARRSSSFNTALSSLARLRQNSQTQFASRGVLCSIHFAYAPPSPCALRRGQLQYGAQQFSQTEAKLADSICKPRRPVLESFCLRAPAALRGAPGELARCSSSFNTALSSSARLRQNSQTQFASRGVLCSIYFAYAPPPQAVSGTF